jgi:nitrite reductase/ring-hydroxylating ferredoxin subunit
MAIERITECEVVEVGRHYLVPCVFAAWSYQDGVPRWWPVMGPQHDDVDYLGFSPSHYHLDPRFVPNFVMNRRHSIYCEITLDVFNIPLQTSSGERLPETEYRRMQCRREMPNRPEARFVHQKLSKAFQGTPLGTHQQCPHKGYSLRGIKPESDGCLKCPLHGLQFKDGVCIG